MSKPQWRLVEEAKERAVKEREEAERKAKAEKLASLGSTSHAEDVPVVQKSEVCHFVVIPLLCLGRDHAGPFKVVKSLVLLDFRIRIFVGLHLLINALRPSSHCRFQSNYPSWGW